MGYMKHDAIVVTSWSDTAIDEAAERARHLRLDVLGPSMAATNGYRSMLVCPDGSKEGWTESEIHDGRRTEFIEWLNSQRYDDGSTSLHWVAVSYSADDEEASITTHAWAAPLTAGKAER